MHATADPKAYAAGGGDDERSDDERPSEHVIRYRARARHTIPCRWPAADCRAASYARAFLFDAAARFDLAGFAADFDLDFAADFLLPCTASWRAIIVSTLQALITPATASKARASAVLKRTHALPMRDSSARRSAGNDARYWDTVVAALATMAPLQ